MINYARIESTSRFPYQWLLPEVVRRLEAAPGTISVDARRRAEAMDEYILRAAIEDLSSRPPTLILIDVREEKSYFYGRPFDYVRHFSRDPRIAAVLSRYEPWTDVGGFRFYRRKGGGACETAADRAGFTGS